MFVTLLKSNNKNYVDFCIKDLQNDLLNAVLNSNKGEIIYMNFKINDEKQLKELVQAYEVDLVIGADGAKSTIASIMTPEHQYCEFSTQSYVLQVQYEVSTSMNTTPLKLMTECHAVCKYLPRLVHESVKNNRVILRIELSNNEYKSKTPLIVDSVNVFNDMLSNDVRKCVSGWINARSLYRLRNITYQIV